MTDKTAAEWLEDGRTERAAGHHSQALDAAQHAVALLENGKSGSDEAVEARMLAAQSLTSLQRPEEAVASYEQAAAEYGEASEPDPGLAAVYAYWASGLLDANHLEEASEKAARAVELYGETTEPAQVLEIAYVTWVVALVRLGQFDDAVEKAGQAAPFFADQEEARTIILGAYTGWAAAAEAAGQTDQAAGAQLMLAGLLLGYSRFAEVVEHVQEALRLRPAGEPPDPPGGGMYACWALALAGLSQVEQSAEKAEHAVKLFGDAQPPDQPASNAHFALSSALLQLNQTEQALTHAEESVRLFGPAEPPAPDLASMYAHLAAALLNSGRYEEASQKAETAVELRGEASAPDQLLAIAFANWSGALVNLRESQEAAEKAAKAIEMCGEVSPPNQLAAIAYSNWAGALANLESPEDAGQKAAKAVEMAGDEAPNPLAAMAYANWSGSLLKLEHYEEAAEKARLAIETAGQVEPPDRTLTLAYINLAGALANTGPLEEAREAAEKADAYLGTAELRDLRVTLFVNWSAILLGLDRLVDAAEKAEKAVGFAGEVTPPNALVALAYRNWASALIRLQRPRDALEQVDHATLLWGDVDGVDPQLALMYDLKADALVGLERLEEALDASARAVELYGDRRDRAACAMHLTWGDALYRLTRYPEALEHYELGIKIDAGYAPTRIGRAHALSALDRQAEAMEEYQQAVRLYGDSQVRTGAGLLSWGDALTALGMEDEALDRYRAAAKAAPELAEAHFRTAATLYNAGRYALAQPVWKRTVEAYRQRIESTSSPNPEDRYVYGLVLQGIFQDLREAERQLYCALDSDPSSVDTLVSLVDLHVAQAQDAAASLGSASIGTGGTTGREVFGPARKARLRFGQAKREIERQREGGTLPNPDLQLGQLCLKMEEYEQAAPHLEAAEKVSPEAAEVLAALGVLYRQSGDTKRAVRYLTRALSRTPDDLDVATALAQAYYQDGALVEAEDQYERILRITGDHTEAHFGLGDVNLALGTDDNTEPYDRAIGHYDLAIDLGKPSGRPSSKRLSRSELAQVNYARGYARVRLYETSGLRGKDEGLLRRALSDFEEAIAQDAGHLSAQRAATQLQERRRSLSRERKSRTIGPALIAIGALAVFIATQLAFLGHLPDRHISSTSYIALTFGSLLFLIAGLSLPELLKLKVGGFELEKEAVLEVADIRPLRISRPPSVRQGPAVGATSGSLGSAS